MKRIVVGSENPVKIAAVRNGFSRMFAGEVFEVLGVVAPSGVSHQPDSDGEALQGALNRASYAMQAVSEANFWVGIEGGVEERGRELAAFAWIVIRSKDALGKGRTGTFFLPQAVAELIREGKELGEADDIIFGRSNSKQENGAIGILTGDVIDRTQLYEHAVILALVTFKNRDLYP